MGRDSYLRGCGLYMRWSRRCVGRGAYRSKVSDSIDDFVQRCHNARTCLKKRVEGGWSCLFTPFQYTRLVQQLVLYRYLPTKRLQQFLQEAALENSALLERQARRVLIELEYLTSETKYVQSSTGSLLGS